MPKASDHLATGLRKMLYIGDSGTGKTTSLISLVKAGYILRIFDFDNLLDPLLILCRRECPEQLDNIEFMSFRDKMKMTEQGPIVEGMPKGIYQLPKSPVQMGGRHQPVNRVDLQARSCGGQPYDPVAGCLLLGQGYARHQRPSRGIQLKGSSGNRGVDGRQVFYTAQQGLMNTVAHLTGADFNTNLIVIAHVKYLEQDGQTKGFPISIGTAIAPEIPTYFPLISLATKKGETRIIRTRSTNMIDLKDPKAFDPAYASEMPMDRGLAEIFK
jgi:hypothetical protein